MMMMNVVVVDMGIRRWAMDGIQTGLKESLSLIEWDVIWLFIHQCQPQESTEGSSLFNDFDVRNCIGSPTIYRNANSRCVLIPICNCSADHQLLRLELHR